MGKETERARATAAEETKGQRLRKIGYGRNMNNNGEIFFRGANSASSLSHFTRNSVKDLPTVIVEQKQDCVLGA